MTSEIHEAAIAMSEVCCRNRFERHTGWNGESLPRAFWVIICAVSFPMLAKAQVPLHPENLQVLPKTLSTDSVWKLMGNVTIGLGVSCGYCHVGGDRVNWDSTHFASDSIPMKTTARAMFRLTETLNAELLPPLRLGPSAPVLVTCETCHRGAPRPLAIEDTLTRVIESQGVDSALSVYQRIRDRFAGRMAYDFREFRLNNVAARLSVAGRFRDAAKFLEVNSRLFPNSASAALQLGLAYEKAGENALAITQYHKVLAMLPTNELAEQHLRTLMAAKKPL
jgi:hypothetical protein